MVCPARIAPGLEIGMAETDVIEPVGAGDHSRSLSSPRGQSVKGSGSLDRRTGKAMGGAKPLSSPGRENISIYRISDFAYVTCVPSRQRGAYRDRHDTRGGEAVDGKAPTDERRPSRTAKSCGPGAPEIRRQARADACASHGRRWQTEWFTEESTL